MSLKTLQIRYQTARSLPAPYAYFYTLALTPLVGELGVELTLVYPDRDDMDEEELLADGFTPDDDLTWAGRLPQTWRQTMLTLADKARLKPVDEDQLSEDDEFWSVRIETPNVPTRQGRPQHADDWQYVVQELIQAIYERAGRERPFELTYLKIRSPADVQETRLTASFASRTVQVFTSHNEQERTRTLPWPTLQRVMSAVYAPDYDPEKARHKRPREAGHWLSLGTDEWYDISDFSDVTSVLQAV
ncbi:MAG: hypothetical protein H7319_12845 [Spirosoma sp.]|nr:hypothetical protein [Spirosoma sp.]